MENRRMHPGRIILSLYELIKNTAIVFIFLFILRRGSEAGWVVAGRWIFIAAITISVLNIVLSWWRTTYRLEADSVQIDSGVFSRKHRNVPFRRVQNVNRQVPAVLRLFGLTSLTLETGADGEDASVKFLAVTKAEAARIEEALDGYRRERMEAARAVPGAEGMEGGASEIQEPLPENVRTVHFTPELKDVLKASFLSFSFIALIPVLATIYSNIDDFFDVESQAEGFLSFLAGSGVVLGITIALFAVAAIAFGIIRTYLKYGRYEISSDDERIYIRRGVLTEQSLSVRKKNVQAVQITETPLKRLLGLAEAKLVTVGSFEDNLEDISSLYPFLRKQRAVELVGELLPDIRVQDGMERLPKAALTVRMLRFPLTAVIGTVVLYFWRPDFSYIPDWPFLAAALFAFIYLLRYFDYRNTRYAISGPFVQFRKGGLWRETFLSKREKVIEAAVSQSWLQKRFGVATVGTTNRAKPVHVEELKDLPAAAAEQFDQWYTERNPELIRGDEEAAPWKTLQSES
ncbi:hypothetical protein AV656_12890 [Bhargavaea cecembensis]|uniref:YdbS-like PH domain-containing protein n=1 Tax=Bhargavaea cecembensis TaxID=394098 RepID=A0A163EXV8_9BACL|nr:PH domain-containing protein [Bhargavaea cecembensis]KZE37457.1 hypothetical protein AV656_12890 [Bhargavaea cecembensis]